MGVSLKNIVPGILERSSKIWMAICNHKYLKSEAFWHTAWINKSWASSVREKCPNIQFFLVRISPYSVWIWENMDQKNLHIWTRFKQWLCKQTKRFYSLSVILQIWLLYMSELNVSVKVDFVRMLLKNFDLMSENFWKNRKILSEKRHTFCSSCLTYPLRC